MVAWDCCPVVTCCGGAVGRCGAPEVVVLGTPEPVPVALFPVVFLGELPRESRVRSLLRLRSFLLLRSGLELRLCLRLGLRLRSGLRLRLRLRSGLRGPSR